MATDTDMALLIEDYQEQVRENRVIRAEAKRLASVAEHGTDRDYETYDEYTDYAVAPANEALADSAVALLTALGYGEA